VSFFRRLVERCKHKPAVEGPRSRQPGAEGQGSVPGIRTDIGGDAATVTVDLDEFGSEARPLLLDELSQASGLPVFSGAVEHGYATRSVGSHLQCPRCNAATQQHMAHFIYATDIAPRVMFAPAGYFCTTCPTVIVDESLIAKGMKEGYRFRAVVGVDYAGEKQPDFFKTWNGQESIYLLDEDGRVMDLTTDNQLHVDSPGARAGASQDSAARKRRRKMAQQSRQRNRR
jgi:hypothetical protein